MAARGLECDVLIVGGGMVGLTLACALAGAGVRSVVVDRQSPRAMLAAAYDGRASAFAAGSVRLLRAIGVWEAMAAAAQPILEIRVSDGDSRLFLHYDHRALGAEPLGQMVENRVLRRALDRRAAALPALIRLAPARLARLERSAHRVRAALADGTKIVARLAVAADGKGSVVREQAGIAVGRLAYRQTAIVCTVAHERPHRGIAQERFLAAGPFAILPLTGERSSLVWAERADLAPAILALDEEAFARELAWRFTDYLGALAPTGPRWSYPLELSWAWRITAPRLALVGDAAHAIHPLAGQGLNLGLRDAAALAESVVDAARLGLDIGASDVLARYARRRRFDALTMSVTTDGLNRLFSNDIMPLRAARDLGLAAVERMPALKRLFMRHAMGLLGDLPRPVRGEPL
jgi:2-octaprenyl-6-methoxyphenol hydroxylase